MLAICIQRYHRCGPLFERASKPEYESACLSSIAIFPNQGDWQIFDGLSGSILRSVINEDNMFSALQCAPDDVANRGYLVESGNDDIHVSAKCSLTSGL